MSLNTISIEQLLQTPVCMMTGEQLAFLMNNLSFLSERKESASPVPTPDRKLAYGIKGIAETFGCSIPTANRIKKSGIIDKAITQKINPSVHIFIRTDGRERKIQDQP